MEDKIRGFYEQPQNTIETVFLGPSMTVCGIIPIELYRDYGMCAYNLATERGYITTAYYLLQEAFDRHGDSLKNVVLDARALIPGRQDDVFRKVMDRVHFSSRKIRFLYDYTGSWTETLHYLLPLWIYHERWDSLTKTDFEKITYDPAAYLRGYQFRDDLTLDKLSYDQVNLRFYYDETTSGYEFYEEALVYFDKLAAFCSDNGLNLILNHPPGLGLTTLHNGINSLAEKYGVDFIDFNLEPYISEIDYNRALGTFDSGHPNYYLATKWTSWFGRYLSDHYEVTDVRGNEDYAFMDEELRLYEKNVCAGIYMDELTDLLQYLEYAAEREYMLLISVRDEGSGGLTEAYRALLADYGLEKISELQWRDSYLAIIDGGNVAYEASQEAGATGKPISYDYILKDGAKVELVSGGLLDGDVSSCLVDGTEHSLSRRGLNIVVYDADISRVVNVANFDTCASTERESVNLQIAYEAAIEQGVPFSKMSDRMRKLHLYNRRVENDKISRALDQQMEEDDLQLFLDAYWEKPDTAIFISVFDEASGTFDSEIRGLFTQKYGLSVLAELEWRDSYLAVIDNGKVLFEQKDHGESPLWWSGIRYSFDNRPEESGWLSSINVEDPDPQSGLNIEVYDTSLEEYVDFNPKDMGEVPLTWNGIKCSVVSGGLESGNVSSINIKGVDYSMRQRGLNIVVYDTLLGQVINQASFDTCGIPQKH